ncbi:uncharacterized protein LOC118279232 isoform X4 [Spodoptera frugiperda]|uniref:Uncharacterized protein LOC118279232 isoform X4 n=1 Tax=Spodoptera frugiperda TaxID=7108 RepID=A0A9R0ES56_SPOFR|nr:uncharacterized protein LOC118279232 isoform X4 [Spodoptera frugiperda]
MPPASEEDMSPMPGDTSSVTIYQVIYISVLFTVLFMAFVIMCIKMAQLGQKTRSPQQRRMYVGSRARPSLGQAEPSIFVSPSNLPPPPKYECMAPPSYEEVVGVHYPNYQVQPITQPITTALAQTSTDTTTRPDSRSNETVVRNNDETVVTVVSAPRVATTSS